jgi:hypothetical protein
MSWDGLIEIVNPGHRHLREERDRKRVEAQIPGREGDPDFGKCDRGVRIDFWRDGSWS